jgi:hypothetical protein
MRKHLAMMAKVVLIFFPMFLAVGLVIASGNLGFFLVMGMAQFPWGLIALALCSPRESAPLFSVTVTTTTRRT